MMNACCIICSDRFLSGDDELNIAAGKCGHTFHSSCLDTWLATSATCPKCRQKWSKKEVIRKLYFEYDTTTTEKDCESRLVNEVNSVRAQLAQAEHKVKTLTKELNETLDSKQELSTCFEDICQQSNVMVSEKRDLEKQLKFYQSCEKMWKDREKECVKLRDLLQNYRQIERLVKDSESDSRDLVKSLMSGSGAVDRLANMCTIIKREYVQCKHSKKIQRLELDQTRKELASLRVQMSEVQNENKVLKEQCQRMEEQLTEAEKREESLRAKASKRLSHDLSEPIPSTSRASDENLMSKCSSDFLSSDKEHFGNSHSKFSFINDNDIENNKQTMNFKLTSAANKKSRLLSTSNQSLVMSSKAVIDRSPQVPILQNFRRGYDGLGGHTSFTKSLVFQGSRPLRPINASRKNSTSMKK